MPPAVARSPLHSSQTPRTVFRSAATSVAAASRPAGLLLHRLMHGGASPLIASPWVCEHRRGIMTTGTMRGRASLASAVQSAQHHTARDRLDTDGRSAASGGEVRQRTARQHPVDGRVLQARPQDRGAGAVRRRRPTADLRRPPGRTHPGPRPARRPNVTVRRQPSRRSSSGLSIWSVRR